MSLYHRDLVLANTTSLFRRFDKAGRPLPGHPIDHVNLLQGLQFHHLIAIEHTLNYFGYGAEADQSLEEGLYRNLVGGVQDGRRASAGTERLAGQPQRGKANRIGRLEGIAAIGVAFGQILAASGQKEQGLAVLRTSLEGFRKLGRHDTAQGVEQLIAKIQGDE